MKVCKTASYAECSKALNAKVKASFDSITSAAQPPKTKFEMALPTIYKMWSEQK